MNQLHMYWERYPLGSVLLIALVVRMFAVLFAQGYLMHDDHFLVIEAASSWAVGEDYNNWLPWNIPEGGQEHPFNFAYVGSQYIVLKAFHAMGLEDPKMQMYLIRFFHALYSLLIVFFGFRIAELLSKKDEKMKHLPRTVGLVLALLAFMPNFSVRNLVEMVCIPPLMWSFYLLLKHQGSTKIKHYLIAGIGIGIATTLRYQCGVFGIGLGIVLLIQKQLKGAIALGFSSLFFFSLGQLPDYFIWGEPFKQLQVYMEYNSDPKNVEGYPQGPWYQYILTILGFLVPPLSVMFVFGFLREWKKQLLLVLPILAFLVFHSFYPNKQERFILPALPLLIAVGAYGWKRFVLESKYWCSHAKLLSGLWAFFWVVNILGMLILTFSYTKKSRVESMYFLYQQGDLHNFISAGAQDQIMSPQHYTGIWTAYHNHYSHANNDVLKHQVTSSTLEKRPNYIVFYGSKGIDERVEEVKELMPNIRYMATFQPGLLDRLLHFLNPINPLEEARVYSLPPQDIVFDDEEPEVNDPSFDGAPKP